MRQRDHHPDDSARAAAIHDLRRIPGVGASIAEDLWNIGVRSVADLHSGDPDDLYVRICLHEGVPVDRCMLYVLRCAVYFASNTVHDPELLKWWRWKDGPAVPSLTTASASSAGPVSVTSN